MRGPVLLFTSCPVIGRLRMCLLLLAALGCAFALPGALGEEGARVRFAVWAIGLPDGYMVMDHQARVSPQE